MDVGDYIATRVREAIVGALADAQGELTAIAQAGGQAANPGQGGSSGGASGLLTGILAALGAAGATFLSGVELLGAAEAAAGGQGVGFGIGYLLGYALWTAVEPILEPLNHEVASLAQTAIFDPATAATLQAKGIIDDTYGRSEAAGGNMSGEHYDKLVDAASGRPALAELLELLRRGLTDSATFAKAMTRNQVDPYWIPILEQLQTVLLSPADLALAQLRGIITPAEATAYAALLGVSQIDLDVLVGNTGEPPGLMQLLEAFRRGFIDQATLERGIRQSRVRDEWIPTVEALRYTPMSTADAVRAVVENYLTDDQGADIANQNGLEPAHWRPLVDAFGRPLAHEQMMSLYHRGLVTRAQVDQAFRESDLKNKYVDLSFELGRRLIPERQIVTALEHGAIDDKEAAVRLLELGFTQADADILIKTGTSARTTAHKQISAAQSLAMYEDGIIAKDTATDQLVALGYSAHDADLEVQLADAKAKAALVKSSVSAIRVQFDRRLVDHDRAIAELTAIGISAKQAEQLTDLWQAARGAVVKSLTEAQIVHIAKAGAIAPPDAFTRLVELGYTPTDANLLLEVYAGLGAQPVP